MAETARSNLAPATLENWYWGPANRWAWRNMRRLFPTARVGRGPGPASPLPPAPQDLGDIAFNDPIVGSTSVEAMLLSTFTDAFIVLKEGAVVCERYFNGMAPGEPHLLMSVTKSVVGALVGILHHQGRLDLEAPVERFLPELASTSFAGASLRRLIDMQVSRPLAPSYDEIDAAAGWLPGDDGGGLLAYLTRPGAPLGPHGRRFVYLTENTTLASLIIERATGQDFNALIEEELWSKIGAEHDADLLLDARQIAFTSPGLNASLRDIARFGAMMAQDGRWNGAQIVPESWVHDLRFNQEHAAWAAGMASEDIPAFQRGLASAPGFAHGSYRSFWWVADQQLGRFSAIGLGAQTIVVDPKAQVVIVKLSSPPDAAAGGRATLSQFYAADAIIRALS